MQAIINALVGPCRDFFGYIMSLEKNINSLETEMGELKSRRKKLKKEVKIAERWGREPSISVNEWLNRAKSLEREMTLIHTRWEKRVRCLGDCSANLWSSYDLSKKAEEKSKAAVDLKSKYPLDELANQMLPARPVNMPSAELIGRETVLEQLRHLVADEKVGIIGIHGMGGVGKTSLLERLYNEFLKDFAVIWIEATRGLNVEEIQRVLGDQLGLPWKGKISPKERAAILVSELSKMRFMLILDGLWEHLDLKMVGIPTLDHRSRSKIILTTRIETVCDRMGAEKIKVECLAAEEAWDLFQRKAGRELITSNFQIRNYAEKLEKKCGGLPLPLTIIGRAMASKKTAEEWKHTVTSLNTKPWEVPGMREVLECLKLSYEELHDAKLRTCLVYASLIGDDFTEVRLIDYCMGEGVIDDFDDPEEAYNTGHYLLGVLKASSLLEMGSSENLMRMHPMIRKMVIWVGCECGKQENKLLVRTGNSLDAAPVVDRWRGAARISLTRTKIDTLPESPHCHELLTLFLQHNYHLTKIPGGLFQFMPNLKVLDLSYSPIRELLAGIALLTGLQHLNLRETQITSLPVELGRLINLRFLILYSAGGLQKIPKGLIASLSGLRVLQMYGSYAIWEASSSGEGVGVAELENIETLRVLGISLGRASALKRLSGSRQLATAVRDLYLCSCRGLTTVQLPSSTIGRNMDSLRCLAIVGCCDLEQVIIGNGTGGHGGEEGSFLPCLQNIFLHQLPRAKIIWRSECLQNLKYLWIQDCEAIVQLMDFEDEEAKGDARECEPFVAFPSLVQIVLQNLPEFKSLSIGGRALAFPSLTDLRVKNCPKLKKLTLVPDKLVEIRGEKKWYDALEWENASLKSSFSLEL